MIDFIKRRLLMLLPVLIGISIVVFLVMHMAPGDPAEILAGPMASASDIAALRAKLGLDDPVYVQYWRFVRGALKGDLGTSVQSEEPVAEMLRTRFPNTLALSIAAMIVASVIGLSAGIVSAVRKGSFFDSLSMIVALLGISLPSFWIGLMLMLIFAVRLRWLPVAGYNGEWWTIAGIKQLVLPALTLGIGTAALIARITRSSILEVMQQDYVRTARAKGLSQVATVGKHVLRNAMAPVITVMGLNFGGLLGGTVVTESVFAINGVGRMMVRAITSRDFPVVQGAVLLVATTFVLINLLVDIAYAMLDPRIRYD
ncbi:MAG: ABC transporter permease [Firmicutes bacterium]|nr:ABC transporter permease [Bacillota bacterium]